MSKLASVLSLAVSLIALPVAAASINPVASTTSGVIVDRSGVTPSIPGESVQVFAYDSTRTSARITNLGTGPDAVLYIYDKGAGAPTRGNSFPISATQQVQWTGGDAVGPIVVFARSPSVPFEAGER